MARTYVLQLLPEKKEYLHSIQIDDRVKIQGVQGIQTAVSTPDRNKCLKINGTADFAAGYAAAISAIFNLNLLPVRTS